MKARPGEQGAALVIVLWGLALLSALLAGFATLGRSEVNLTAAMVEQARARHLADAGVALAAAALLDPDARESLRVDGTQWRREVDGVPLSIRIQDEAGKVDLNFAPLSLLNGLFRQAGLPAGAAAGLAAVVVDWRDEDDRRSRNGAEAADWLAAGWPGGPKNRPFDSIAELGQIPGVTPEVFRRLEPLVTVHGLQPGIDPTVAPAPIMRALPGAGAEEVAALLRHRPPAALDRPARIEARPALQRWFVSSPHLAFGVTVEVPTASGGVVRRDSVIWLGHREDGPFTILVWR